ncbi:oxidoreductase [Leptospira gomenensis]|uniref:Oxidoreductase n=1 Tax=Leptospira gomenensis TaxID=2484974 RepID=A0A5F1YC12_9LEPT|nr:oxidoreductase [Leptospira gomenensis]TGK32425.1 oxidoreductase [Leptospira gomenensis]TGK34678.1 oxidoreductase [Leptospira gomenensis]TGK51025.1 oxidoreductase [Leptospira gomenensis]TGK68334.1 oxidoreductase [Leptospira gomenensis]
MKPSAFTLKPGLVHGKFSRKTVLEEPFTLFPEPGALYLKEFPTRVRAGEPLVRQSVGTLLSPVDGIASLIQGEHSTKIRIVQDGSFQLLGDQSSDSPLGLDQTLEKMDRTGLISLDFPDTTLSALFRTFQESTIVLSPYTKTQAVDFKKMIVEEYKTLHIQFLECLSLWFPKASVRDYVLSPVPFRKYEYPSGFPQYFVKRAFGEKNFQKEKILYLGPETLYHLYRALFKGIPFIERHISIYYVGKNGGLKKEESPIKFRDGQSLSFLLQEKKREYPNFTFNSFFDGGTFHSSSEEYFLDIYKHHSILFVSGAIREQRELPCTECGECTYNCPLECNPIALVTGQGKFSSSACIECGICTFLCPSGISLRDRIRKTKEEGTARV